MDNFLVSIDYDEVSNCYVANYLLGDSVSLQASTYEDAVCEADTIEIGCD